jgi:hypothetical protein
MRKLVYAVAVVSVLIVTGCSSMGGGVRADIKTMTRDSNYQTNAREFLDDGVMGGISRITDGVNTKNYCKDLVRDSALKPLVSVNSCSNFVSFANSLTPEETRKLLIFLGRDYFGVNWTKNLYSSGYTPKRIKDRERKLVDDGFDSAAANDGVLDFASFSGKAGASAREADYYQQNLDWLSRNAGLAMYTWFKRHGDGTSILTPQTVAELIKSYSLRKSKSSTANVAPPSKELTEFMDVLGKGQPDYRTLRGFTVETVTDTQLAEVMRYARWVAEGKHSVRSEK